MADTKITALTALTAADPANDVIPIVDVSDTSMAASGTTKKISVNNILGASGTATLASATITGDLTVDTSTLKVDSTNNRVGIGTASPSGIFHAANLGTAGTTADNFNGYFSSANRNSNVYILAKNTEGSNLYFGDGESNTVGAVIYDHTSNYMRFDVNGIEQYRIAPLGVNTWLDGAGGTRMTLNSTGLGVGIVPSSFGRFSVQGTAGGAGILGMNTDATQCDIQSYNKPLALNRAGNNITMCEGGGNVGIGVTPSAWGAGYKGVQLGTGLSLMGSTINGTIAANAYFDGTNWKYITANPSAQYYCSYFANGSHVWTTSTGVPSIGGNITFTQAMTLDASGNLLVGLASGALVSSASRLRITTGSGPTIDAQSTVTGNAVVEEWNSATTGDNVFNNFRTEAAGTTRGSITYNRTGGLVAYNVTSDYRAKDIIGPVSNSGSLIDSLKVYLGRMKGATIARPMLIAHEAQEVAPYSVTGIKDEVDADGKDKYQQMDVSSFVPLLIAEIQSLRTRVQTLEAR